MLRGCNFAWALAALAWLPDASVHGQEREAPAELRLGWDYATPGATPQALALDAAGRPLLFAALKQGGLAVLELGRGSEPPRELARLECDAFAGLHVMHFAQSGERLYLALGDFFAARGAKAGLAAVDTADPRRPRVAAQWTSDKPLKGSAHVAVEGRWAYLAAMTEGVFAFDLSDPARLTLAGTFQPDPHFPRKNPGAVQHPNARGLALRGERLFVAYDAGGLRVLDVSDPRAPREVGRYLNAGMAAKQQAYNNLVLDGERAYVAVDYAGLEILDVRDPAAIRPLGWWNPWAADTLRNLWFNSPGHTNQLVFDPRRREVWLSAGDSELQVVDVSEPARPRLAARYGAPGDKLGAWGLTADRDAAYLAYMEAIIPFRGTWAGIKRVER